MQFFLAARTWLQFPGLSTKCFLGCLRFRTRTMLGWASPELLSILNSLQPVPRGRVPRWWCLCSLRCGRRTPTWKPCRSQELISKQVADPSHRSAPLLYSPQIFSTSCLPKARKVLASRTCLPASSWSLWFSSLIQPSRIHLFCGFIQYWLR